MMIAPLSDRQEESEKLRREIMQSMGTDPLPEDSAALSRLWCGEYEEQLLDEMLSYDLQDLGRFAYVGATPKEINPIPDNLEALKGLGNVQKLPAKGSIGNGRWCTSQCKKQVGEVAIRNIYQLKTRASHLRLPQKRVAGSGRFCTGRCKNDVGDTVVRNIFTLKEQSSRLRFPAKGSLWNGRYCTSVTKATVYDKAMRLHSDTREGVKVLVVSGERRGESTNRSKYNEIELSPCNATAKGNRLVHHWRLVIDYSEADVWAVLRRHRCVPHPCYSLGWNRCSCAMCIFSRREQWAGIRELFPQHYEAVCRDEIILGFTLSVYQTLDEYVGNAVSCVYHDDPVAMHQILKGVFTPKDLYTHNWRYPAGAFHGAEGGPC